MALATTMMGCKKPVKVPRYKPFFCRVFHLKGSSDARKVDGDQQEKRITERKYRYKAVHVLLLSFHNPGDDDDPFYSTKRSSLKSLQAVFEKNYGYHTEIFRIPLENSQKHAYTYVNEFQRKYAVPENLLIVVYAGHGGYVEEKKDGGDSFRIGSEGADVDWLPLQLELEKSPSDVVFIMDSCHAGGSTNSSIQLDVEKTSRKELFAACGRDSLSYCLIRNRILGFLLPEGRFVWYQVCTLGFRSPLRGLNFSFAVELIKELRKRASGPDFSFEEVCHAIQEKCKDGYDWLSTPHRADTTNVKPIYVTLRGNREGPCIQIRSLKC
jgi:hypothetical protein